MIKIKCRKKGSATEKQINYINKLTNSKLKEIRSKTDASNFSIKEASIIIDAVKNKEKVVLSTDNEDFILNAGDVYESFRDEEAYSENERKFIMTTLEDFNVRYGFLDLDDIFADLGRSEIYKQKCTSQKIYQAANAVIDAIGTAKLVQYYEHKEFKNLKYQFFSDFFLTIENKNDLITLLEKKLVDRKRKANEAVFAAKLEFKIESEAAPAASVSEAAPAASVSEAVLKVLENIDLEKELTKELSELEKELIELMQTAAAVKAAVKAETPEQIPIPAPVAQETKPEQEIKPEQEQGEWAGMFDMIEEFPTPALVEQVTEQETKPEQQQALTDAEVTDTEVEEVTDAVTDAVTEVEDAETKEYRVWITSQSEDIAEKLFAIWKGGNESGWEIFDSNSVLSHSAPQQFKDFTRLYYDICIEQNDDPYCLNTIDEIFVAPATPEQIPTPATPEQEQGETIEVVEVVEVEEEVNNDNNIPYADEVPVQEVEYRSAEQTKFTKLPIPKHASAKPRKTRKTKTVQEETVQEETEEEGKVVYIAEEEDLIPTPAPSRPAKRTKSTNKTRAKRIKILVDSNIVSTSGERRETMYFNAETKEYKTKSELFKLLSLNAVTEQKYFSTRAKKAGWAFAGYAYAYDKDTNTLYTKQQVVDMIVEEKKDFSGTEDAEKYREKVRKNFSYYAKKAKFSLVKTTKFVLIDAA